MFNKSDNELNMLLPKPDVTLDVVVLEMSDCAISLK